ncbi:hypothetical protein P4U24_08890 [Aeribacillus composti]|uniref:hypothetical protein n=1 Tax=Aeribacillus composti TaxID=1868734 RepID=UPI002E2404E5|nr:hypothetical protein [Aeribacillus composti]
MKTMTMSKVNKINMANDVNVVDVVEVSGCKWKDYSNLRRNLIYEENDCIRSAETT